MAVRLRRLLALLLLVAFAVGLGQDLLTRGDDYVAHVICPEHGDVMHAFAPQSAGEVGFKALPTRAHGKGCELATMGPAPTPAQPAPSLTLPPLLVTGLHVDRAAPTLDRRDPRVIGYAPKTSPPVV